MDNDKKRTPEEIDDLKAQWLADPCWDLYETEGFEAHRQELARFQIEQEMEMRHRVSERREKLLQEWGVSDLFGVIRLRDVGGLSPRERFATEVERLYERIAELEKKVKQLEGEDGSR